MSMPAAVNLNRPRLVDTGKLSEAELSDLLEHHFAPHGAGNPAAQSAIAAVAAGLAMQTTRSERGNALTDDQVDERYRAAAELADEPECEAPRMSDLQAAVWSGVGLLVIGVLAVLL